MIKYINGIYRNMTAEEIAAIEAEVARYEAIERTRPFTESEVSRMLIAQQINTLSVDDNTALRMVAFYPEWAENTEYTAEYKVQHNGKLWRCRQAHTSQSGWEPENAQAMWKAIWESHAGTLEDPISYGGNMEVEGGK